MSEARATELLQLWASRCGPLVYDPLVWLGERMGMAELRRETAGRAAGRVLELGAGTGLNLPYYGPAVSELVLTEPEPAMARRLAKRVQRERAGTRLIEAPAEQLPFADDSFDAIVATLVFCTIADPLAALQEARRVLADGGRLLFLEHVRAPGGSALERWQDRLYRPWRALAAGCRCNQDTPALLAQGGFEIAVQRREHWHAMPPIVRPLVCGVALAA